MIYIVHSVYYIIVYIWDAATIVQVYINIIAKPLLWLKLLCEMLPFFTFCGGNNPNARNPAYSITAHAPQNLITDLCILRNPYKPLQ